jgi:hypothetical protein
MYSLLVISSTVAYDMVFKLNYGLTNYCVTYVTKALLLRI